MFTDFFPCVSVFFQGLEVRDVPVCSPPLVESRSSDVAVLEPRGVLGVCVASSNSVVCVHLFSGFLFFDHSLFDHVLHLVEAEWVNSCDEDSGSGVSSVFGECDNEEVLLGLLVSDAVGLVIKQESLVVVEDCLDAKLFFDGLPCDVEKLSFVSLH